MVDFEDGAPTWGEGSIFTIPSQERRRPPTKAGTKAREYFTSGRKRYANANNDTETKHLYADWLTRRGVCRRRKAHDSRISRDCTIAMTRSSRPRLKMSSTNLPGVSRRYEAQQEGRTRSGPSAGMGLPKGPPKMCWRHLTETVARDPNHMHVRRSPAFECGSISYVGGGRHGL